MKRFACFLVLAGCPAPEDPTQQVGYRDGRDGGANSGERGTVKISEIMWSGSVDENGTWDPDDVFIEIRNEGSRPMNLSGWQIDVSGSLTYTLVIPQLDWALGVGEHKFIAAKESGCFENADIIMPELKLPVGADPFRLTLIDSDERLIEPAGDRYAPPFAGGYDFHVSRSMEKTELIFGARGTEPHAWHFYTPAPVDIPNNTNVAERCRERTYASPGKANSPDYSGAYSTGNFE